MYSESINTQSESMPGHDDVGGWQYLWIMCGRSSSVFLEVTVNKPSRLDFRKISVMGTTIPSSHMQSLTMIVGVPCSVHDEKHIVSLTGGYGVRDWHIIFTHKMGIL